MMIYQPLKIPTRFLDALGLRIMFPDRLKLPASLRGGSG